MTTGVILRAPRVSFLFLACVLCTLISATDAPARVADLASPVSVLQAVKAASGGSRWDCARTIIAQGQKVSFGLTGTFNLISDLTTGNFANSARYGFFGNGEGLDAKGRWRLDNSGVMHSLDSDEAKEVAITEAFLARRGYLFPSSPATLIERLDDITSAGQAFERIAVTPEHGRQVILWIDRLTSQLYRAEIERSEWTETITYSDYRNIEGIWLPFHLILDSGDDSEAGDMKVNTYHLLHQTDSTDPARPLSARVDARITTGAASVEVPLHLDPTSGFVIVYATINGRGPYPFILDTGGHGILTPKAASQLGLRTVGRGVSRGAGAGSTSTEFTKIGKVAIGAAEMTDQTFTVLHTDLGTTRDSTGKSVELAGLIGLEFFERFAVTLDYAAGKLTAQPLETFRYSGTGDQLPIRFTSDMPLVQASIEGHAGSFAVDTGNNIDLILFHRWAMTNGLASQFHLSDAKLDTPGGEVTFAPGEVRVFHLGEQKINSLPAVLAGEHAGSLSSRSEAGNMGNRVLAHFTVIFDYRHELMIIEHRRDGTSD